MFETKLLENETLISGSGRNQQIEVRSSVFNSVVELTYVLLVVISIILVLLVVGPSVRMG